MYPTDKEAKALLLGIGKKMSDSGFVTANDGNLTIRVEEDAVWATPTGVNKGEMTEEMLIKVRISDGAILEGTWKATSELGMHLNAYRTDNEIMSTAHAHPLNLCVLACAGIELDMPTTPAAVCISGRVPVIPYCCSGSQALAESIIPYVKKYHVVNLGNHGPIAWGKNSKEAWYRLEDAEACARLALEIARLGRFRPLNTQQMHELVDYHHIDITADAFQADNDSWENQQSVITFSEFMKNRI